MAKTMFPFLLLILFSYIDYIYCVQVCDDFKYYVKPDKQHCHDNPDGERNLTEILRNWPDVTVEEHYISTEDGYQILVIRAYSTEGGVPIVLGHDAFLTSFGFVNRGKKSLAHHLIVKGFDVWIIIFRGFSYSRGHETLKPSEKEYWKFSCQEVAEYDLGSSLDYVLQKTGQKSIYIGYSAGSILGFIYGSTKVEEAHRTLKGMIALAPLAFLDGMKSYLRFLLLIVDYLKPLIEQKFHGEVPLDPGYYNCSSLFDYYITEVLKVPLNGDDFPEIDPPYLPLIRLQNYPKSIGINIIIHAYQTMKSKKFQAFDYGRDKNLKKYGQDTPPQYNLSKIPVPVTLFVGNNDWIATRVNAERIYSELNPNAQCGFNTVPCDKWNHNDFIEAKDVELFLYKNLFKAIDGLNEGICLNDL